MFPQLQFTADAATITSLVDVAAVVETRLHNAEAHVQVLTRQVQHEEQSRQQYQVRARKWITALRRSHRRSSHAMTSRLFKQALTDLTALESMPRIGKE